jgi:hypothetical protein
MFPATLDELIPEDHVCRVIEAFVGRLAMGGAGICKPRAGGDGATGLRSARCTEAVPVRVHEPATLVATAGGGVSTQRGSDVAGGAGAVGLQVDSRVPAGETLRRQQVQPARRQVAYAGEAAVCGACALRPRCTMAARRIVKRHGYEGALESMRQRATAEAMRLRRCVVERPFAELKYRIFGHPRFLLRGRGGAQTEISLATMAYNLKRMLRVMGGASLRTLPAG